MRAKRGLRSLEIAGEEAEYRSKRVAARFQARGWELLDASPARALAAEERVAHAPSRTGR